MGLIENLTEFATVSLDGSWIAGIVAVTIGMLLNRIHMLNLSLNQIICTNFKCDWFFAKKRHLYN